MTPEEFKIVRYCSDQCWKIANEANPNYENNMKFVAEAITDIALLLEERKVLREALSFYADALNAVGSAMKYDMGYRAKDALAWKPEGVEDV